MAARSVTDETTETAAERTVVRVSALTAGESTDLARLPAIPAIAEAAVKREAGLKLLSLRTFAEADILADNVSASPLNALRVATSKPS
jgi:hypothetical protein